MTTREQRLQEVVARMHDPWGGVHCLDFANTLEPRGGPPPIVPPEGYQFRDELVSYDDLVGWAVHKSTISLELGESLLQVADRDPAAAAAIVTRSHQLRDAIYRAFWQIAHGDTPASDDLAVIMSEYAAATEHANLVAAGTEISLTWNDEPPDLARPLWEVARSAVELLTTGDERRVKVCPGPGRPPFPCHWLFYDTTKNASRRWCSMTDCGAVTKARIQTDRRRAKRVRSSP